MWLYEYGAVTLSWVGEKMWGSRSPVFDWTVGMFFLLGDHSLSPLRGALNQSTGDHLCLQWGDRGLCLLRLLVPCWFWCCMDFSAGLRFYPMLQFSCEVWKKSNSGRGISTLAMRKEQMSTQSLSISKTFAFPCTFLLFFSSICCLRNQAVYKYTSCKQLRCYIKSMEETFSF